ncbi:hypothetical protein ALP32_200412 [Pseudomonas avellanae]|uniref:Uncharacterized protein n=1 Tax=Pseudomonas avellanae TaxID=46257 RepID=A0A3M5T157_9PSED|nr:hypothetical protein ALP32_200412 [Pseudomonas avellanae]
MDYRFQIRLLSASIGGGKGLIEIISCSRAAINESYS